MPTPVPALPPYAALQSLVVGASAGATRAMVVANATAFLRGRVTHPVAHLSNVVGEGYFAYKRRAGVESLRVLAELRQGVSTDSTGTIEVELAPAFGSGTLAWHVGAGGVELNGGMDGTVNLPAPSARLRDYQQFEGYLDVRGLPVGTVVVLKVTCVGGLHALYVDEVPLPVLDPVGAPTTEPGVDAAWTQAGNAIVDGSSGSPRGVGRLLAELTACRGGCPRHWQTSWSLSRNSTSLGPLNSSVASSVDPVHRLRARRVREAGSPNVVTFGAVYRFDPTYSGLLLARLRFDATGLGGGSSTYGEIPLLDTGGAWAHHAQQAQLPTDGTNQELELTFAACTSNTDGVSTTSDPLDVALIYLIEDEA